MRNSDIRKQIRQVLLNPKTVKMAPFLKYWDVFENSGFDVFDTLTEIAAELRNHHEENTTGLSRGNMRYLIKRATEIYFIRITNYFYFRTDDSSGFSIFYVQQKGLVELQDIRRKVQEYRLFILGLLKKWHSDDLNVIDELFEMYQNRDQ